MILIFDTLISHMYYFPRLSIWSPAHPGVLYVLARMPMIFILTAGHRAGFPTRQPSGMGNGSAIRHIGIANITALCCMKARLHRF